MPFITLLKLSTIVLCLLAAVHADHKSSKKNPTIKPTANNPSPASSLLCKSRTLDQVRELYSHWNSALQTRDSDIVAAEYWDDSILLPTISNSIRYNKASKIEYFKDFLKKKPYGTVTEDFIDNTACNYVQVNTCFNGNVGYLVHSFTVVSVCMYYYSTTASMTSR